MKKIGILTHYYQSKNIGGLLQAYALVEYLSKINFIVEQICFDIKFFIKQNKKQKLLLRLENFSFSKILDKIINRFNYKLNIKQNSFFLQQDKKFQEFGNFIKHSKILYRDDTIILANKEYDGIIVGSDQVFVSSFLSHCSFFGEFTTPDKIVISYAASSNLKRFHPKAEKIFIQKLQRFNSISVREKALKEYIESITDKKVRVVLDPTFLLTTKDWLKISNPQVVPNKKYIFCYFLGEKSAWQRTIAQNYADKYGYEVIHLPYIMRTIRSADKYLKGQARYDVGPREFISLINNAECIFTDSFHGMAFAINFNKNFYVFNRDDKETMNSRITNMLDLFELNSRYITNENNILDNISIEYTQVNKILIEEKEKSIEWLLNALKN